MYTLAANVRAAKKQQLFFHSNVKFFAGEKATAGLMVDDVTST